MTKLKGKTVLITGGASGLGRLTAGLMLRRGAKVIIWDIDEKLLAGTVKELSSSGTIEGHRIDVTDTAQVAQAVKGLKEEYGGCDVLVNNAGIVAGKFFHEYSDEEIRRIMAVNSTAPMLVTQAVLPDMLAQNSGHICNISSAAALVPNPKMSVYVASKWALAGWSDSLRVELKKMGKEIRVTTVMPYFTDTGMFRGVRSVIPVQRPEKVARKIVRAIEKDKKILSIPGFIFRTVRLAQAVLPVRGFDWLLGSALGVFRTMDHFSGREIKK